MCLGIPMRVIEVDEHSALCEGRNGRQRINTMLLGRVEVGQWLISFKETGRQVIDEETAALMDAALDGLQVLAAGGELDMNKHFSDLMNTAPSLPDVLRKQ